MKEELKKVVEEIGELIKQLPDGVQEKAFEILLTYELGKLPNQQTVLPNEGAAEKPDVNEANIPAVEAVGGDDLVAADLHLKVRKFLEKQGLSLADLNELFYKEKGEIKPLFEDLKTTESSKTQIRLGLMSALRNAIHTGEFEFSGEDVRNQCQARKAYDYANFKANFRNNGRLFEKFENYEKEKPTIRLSEEGRAELARLIKELQ